ncbi:MAG: peroxide stress protein YaaA [Cytophagales bacterium]|nr:MAG: peroxide stress protein YaaA [Cytophagales bacterium]TAF62295.1 MAG: peroxide stress protein YaaA [Cytophagales bacterium]
MLLLLSPAKNQNFEAKVPTSAHSIPCFETEIADLVAILKQKSPQDLQSMMSISQNLALQNVERYLNFAEKFTPQNAKQAIFAFNGDVYKGLNAASFNEKDLQFAQKHLRILSGLYGLLKPLDLIQPYRLEMGIHLANSMGSNLYQFWQNKLTNLLNEELKNLKAPCLINLASNEYGKAIDFEAIQGQVVHVVFKEFKDNTYKIVGTLAKKARGEMANYIIKNKITTAAKIKLFQENKYSFNSNLSSENEWVFSR